MSDPDLLRVKTVPSSFYPTTYSAVDTNPAIHFGPPQVTVAYLSPSYDELFEARSVNGPGSFDTWKSWSHYKRTCESSGGGFGSALVASDLGNTLVWLDIARPSGPFVLYGGGFGPAGAMTTGLAPLYDPSHGTSFVPAPADLNGLIAASLQSMLPNLRPQLSLVNSIIELKDFKSVKGSIKGILSLPKLLLRKKKRFKDIHELLKVAADLYLQYKFNIAPLVSDINGIIRAVKETEKRLNGLISRSGGRRTCHYVRRFIEYPDPDIEYASPGHVASFYKLDGTQHVSGGTLTDRRQVITQPTEFHAEIQYNYNYTEYQLEHARVLGLLDSLGVNLNPAIVWNAIPWSFVVDWLVGVSQWLGQQRIGFMDPKTNILQYLWSVKRTRLTQVTTTVVNPKFVDWWVDRSAYAPESITHPVVRETSYRREAGLPTASLLTTSGLNSTEFTLGAALVITRKRQRKK